MHANKECQVDINQNCLEEVDCGAASSLMEHFSSLLKTVCILLSAKMMTIVETLNIDIEGLDVTSAKQVLPECITGKNGFCN